MRKLTTYILYYTDITGYSDSCNAYGSKELLTVISNLKKESDLQDLAIYKECKDFENNHDDIIETRKNLWI